jgi:hypothetical protein
MKVVVIGEIIDDLTKVDFKVKDFQSRPYKTQESALRAAYKKVYQKDGNTRRTKNVLTNFYTKDI